MTGRPGSPPRPTKDDLARAANRSIPDVIGPDLQVLFVGINPGLWSGATGRHFARPGNRFWPAIHQAGFTPRQLRPDESDELLRLGIGITNLVNRTTATAAEVSAEELRAGRSILEASLRRYRPASVAVLGVGAYRTAFEEPGAVPGPQARRVAGCPVWVLPNPSGLNAHYQLPQLVVLFRAFRDSLDSD